MIRKTIKYISFLLLFTLFIFKGLIIVFSIFPYYLSEHYRLETQINSEAENKDKSGEKIVDIKELIGHFYNDYTYLIKYAFLSKAGAAKDWQLEKDVFLPNPTPPPKPVLASA